MATPTINGEHHPSRVAAEFEGADLARQAAALLIRQTDIIGHQVLLVDPEDPEIDRKLQPESRGIASTLARSPATLAVIGLVTGLFVGLALLVSGKPLFGGGSPYDTLGTLAGFGALGGMLIAGLIGLRRDHDHLLQWVRAATRQGRWFVLVQARDRDQEQQARQLLDRISDKVMVA